MSGQCWQVMWICIGFTNLFIQEKNVVEISWYDMGFFRLETEDWSMISKTFCLEISCEVIFLASGRKRRLKLNETRYFRASKQFCSIWNEILSSRPSVALGVKSSLMNSKHQQLFLLCSIWNILLQPLFITKSKQPL